jgi:hypothetical protein
MITYFAQLDDTNRVLTVHAVTQEFIDANPDRYPGVWVETFADVEGKTYAGVGFTYNPDTQDFTAPTLEPIA